MKPVERFNAAINLEEPDRVPIAPLVAIDFAATYFGENMAEMHRNPFKALNVVLRLFDEFGGWDGFTTIPLYK